ncbi:DUF3147 family protein [Streptosporangium sp. NPDC004379]|uniref:DUF3147 family protein n=1 Tax=Streptosporangium sp. NPDC004379 TaxID=3366189 RepID=UPI0036BBEE52
MTSDLHGDHEDRRRGLPGGRDSGGGRTGPHDDRGGHGFHGDRDGSGGRRRDDERRDEVRFAPRKLAETRPREWLVRFGFGAGVSALAAVIATVAGPRFGGLFLAFPAILMASLTLVAKKESVRQARNEARGATFGAVGLFGFAAVLAAGLAARWPLWAVLTAATAAWAVLALGCYLLARAFGAGGDEPPAG